MPLIRLGRRAGRADDIDSVIEARAVRSLFQPLVSLDTGEIVAFEALSRGPEGSCLETPEALFGAARTAGRLAELDWVCRAAAYQAAADAGLHADISLLVNNEPAAFSFACPEDLGGVVTQAEARLRVITEVTERAVAANPAELLIAVARSRAVGWGIALDDIGAEPESLAIMPFIRPDVLKLDLPLIQQRSTTESTRVVNAVLAQAERTGATIVAEGIENETQLTRARSTGATIGQGWLFGRPGALPTGTTAPQSPVGLVPDEVADQARTPFEVVSRARQLRRAPKRLLVPLSRNLERKGEDTNEPPVLLACFQDAAYFTGSSQRQFRTLSAHAAFVAALGTGMSTSPMEGVRGADLAPDDPLRGEWDVIVVGPHFAGALVARDCGDRGPEADRSFDFTITYDRDLVVRAARTLLTRIAPI